MAGICTIEKTETGATDWVPWFPVIDRDRCTNCRQCLNFCLFGTYAEDADGRVVVENPSACKTNCPACARICPNVAIIFPKFGESPINGGPVLDEAAEAERVKLDTERILGGDLYATLARRREKALRLRGSTPGAGLLRKDALDEARAERARFLEDEENK